MKRALLGVLGLGIALGATACSLPLFDLALEEKNTCTSDADCGEGVCAPVDGEKACVATSTDLGSVLVEVRPTSDAKGNTVSHVFTNALSLSGEFPNGAIQSLDLNVPPKVTFSGELTAPAPDMCTGVDGSVPTKVELHTVSPFAGLNQTFTTLAEFDDQTKTYRYALDVPAGIYDVYLRPSAPAERPDCKAGALPPRFVANVDVTTNLDFTVSAEPPQRLSGTLLIPKDKSVAGWHLEIVEEKYGLVLSDSMELVDPTDGSQSIQILGGPNGDEPLGLRYYYAGKPILRLRDPNGVLVVHWQLSVVDLDKDGNVDLDIADLVANPLALQATIIDEEAHGVAAAVTIESVLLSGTAKQNASFRVVAESDATGKLDVDLVPGEYRVSIASKSDDTLATGVDKWIVSTDSLGHGKAFVLVKRPLAKGVVESVKGDLLGGMPLVATPSIPPDLSYFSETTAGVSTLLPRESTVTTDALGDFKLAIDPGTVDLSVQPSAGSLYPWFVLPRLLVDTAANKPVLDLDTLTLPAPVIVSGTVRSETSVVPFATVRVLLPIPSSDPQAMATPVVQIGEAITDENGRFTLPLPPSLSTSSAKSSAKK